MKDGGNQTERREHDISDMWSYTKRNVVKIKKEMNVLFHTL
jgi:hypothetical protein